MTRILAAFLAFVLLSGAAHADAINVGAAFGSLSDYINSAIGAAISALVGWALYLLQSKLKVSIDDSMRDALQTWLQRQASSLVADGLVKVSGLQVNVASSTLASVANMAIKEIPDAVAHFGLTPDKLAEMIKDKLPHVPAVAAAVTPPAQ